MKGNGKGLSEPQLTSRETAWDNKGKGLSMTQMRKAYYMQNEIERGV